MPIEAANSGALPEVPRIAESVKSDLASKIQSSFDQVMGSDEPEETPAEETPVEETPAEETAGTEVEQSGEQAAEEEAATETTDEQTEAAAKPAANAGKSPTLPAAYRRSLKAYDWTDEEIDAAAQQPGFLATAAKIHANRVKETQAWADAGRKAKEAQTAGQQPQKDAAPSTTQQQGLKPIDAEALKAEYGDEALIDKLVGPLNATIAQINSILPVVQQTQQRAAMSQAEQLGRQIDGFFGGKEMEPYRELYGANGKLSQEHFAARNKVLEFADYLIGGALQNGRSLSFDEAMTLAHDAISGGTKEQAARQKIVAQAKTRNKGLTLKPGARGSNLNTPAKTRGDLEKRVNQGLRAVLG